MSAPPWGSVIRVTYICPALTIGARQVVFSTTIMKDYMVGFLVLLALVALSVAKKNTPEQERLFEAHPSDCSAYYELQLRQCPQGRLFNIEEQKCDSPENVNCDCKGDGNTCERSPGEEQQGQGSDDHGGYKGNNDENNGNKGHDRREDNGHGNDGDKSNKNGKDHKYDDTDSEENHENDSKEDRDDDDDDSQEGHGKHKRHHGNKEDSDEDDDDSQEGHGKHKGHHGNKEDSDDDDDDSQEGHGKHKGHHGNKEDSNDDGDDSQEGHGKHKGHHGNKEDSGQEGHGKHKGHHGNKEDSNDDDDDSQEGHGKRKGHHGNKEDSHEDRKNSVCKKLERSRHGKWLPRQCSKKSQKLGHVCKLQCSRGFDRSGGSEVRCTESGWEGEYGVNIIPTCMSGSTTTDANDQSTESPTTTTVQEIGDELMNILNNTDGGFEQVLFIVDSSQNVGETTFYHTELNFVKVVTEILFSRISFFGLTTYNDVANVVIPLDEYQSSGFIQRVDDVQYSPRDGSDLANVLDRSFSDIRRTRRRTLVVLITGTESSTDGLGEARLIQAQGNIIIPVVVEEVNRNTAISISSVNEEGSSLYFVFQSWKIFRSTITYISQNYESGSTRATQPTDETSDYRTTYYTTQTSEDEYETTNYGGGSTDATQPTDETQHYRTTDYATQTTEDGYETTNYSTADDTTQSSEDEYETTSGSTTTDANDQSTESPTTTTVEEIGDELMNILNNTDGGFEQVLFIVDSSQNVGETTFYDTELNFVKVVTEILFSRISFFGLTTYNDVANVVIPLDEYQSSGFIQRVDDVQYSPRDGSDLANVLDRSFSDIRRTRRRTLVVLITGTESSTDGSGEARLIQTQGNIIIPVVVEEVNRNTAISISSVNEEGSSLYFVFQSWKIFRSTITYISQNYESGSTRATQPTDETSDYRTTDYTTQTSEDEYETTNYEGGDTDATQPTDETQHYRTTDGTTQTSEDEYETTNYLGGSTDATQPTYETQHYLGGSTDATQPTYETQHYRTTDDTTQTSEDEYETTSGSTTTDANDQSTESPTTTTVEEIGDELMNILNNTDGGFEQVLFIVDSSQNVGETTFYDTELNFVKVVTEILFSRISFFGLTTYNDVANVVIPLDEYQSSGFIQRVDDVQYSPRDGSDLANVLDRSFSDIRRTRRRTLVVLITGTESSTDGSGEARLIQTQGNIIIPVVVEEVNRNTAISISSVNEEGSSLYFVFQSWKIFRSTTTYISQYYEVTEEPTTTASPVVTQSAEEVGDEVVRVVNGTFTGFQQVLFIVDSSRNVGESTFYNTELNFVTAITEVLFSRNSYFGLITFNDDAEVVIPLNEIDSAEFIQRVDSVQYSPRDGSDIANVLDRAFSIIRHSGRRTLVVFISGTESSVDGSGEAGLIKSRGNFIIPIFVGEVNRDTAISISSTSDEGTSVYFLFQNWGIFNVTTTYIRQTYISDSPEEVQVCEVLEKSQRGHWEASNCSSGTSELGTVCELVCEKGYELSGTPEVICNQSGWVSYGGGRNMPSCKTIEEIGEDFISNINRTLGRPANLMFVVDGSGSLTEGEFGLETGLVNAIVRAFPLSERRSAGVVTFSSDATVDVSASSDDTCTFLSDVSAIRYPRGGTNLAQALQLANNELEQNAVHDFTVTFLITDGVSTTDPTESAAVLKRGGNPFFAIGVGDYDAEQLKSIATYFYPIRDFDIFNSLKNVLETDYASRTNVQC
ncbi:uncharacterized protein [Anabrus simplex]|uniref:uncharacterized protein n=1 Tax=Anabrus simplex TaxID=316456 RepID=UPI0035A3B33B